MGSHVRQKTARQREIAWNAGVAAAYFLAAKLGLTLATVGVTVTLHDAVPFTTDARLQVPPTEN